MKFAACTRNFTNFPDGSSELAAAGRVAETYTLLYGEYTCCPAGWFWRCGYGRRACWGSDRLTGARVAE